MLDLKDLQLAPADYFTFREENRTFQRFGLWNAGGVSITGPGAPEQIPSVTVTVDTLPAPGVPPALGHSFNTKDDAAEAVRTTQLRWAAALRRPAILSVQHSRACADRGSDLAAVAASPHGWRRASPAARASAP